MGNLVAASVKRPKHLVLVLLGTWMALSMAWSVWAGLALRTRGVTASDPYAYVQMAVDLVTNGTLLHRFQLSPVAWDLGLPVWPTAHVGYQVPDHDSALAASVWPPGAAVLLGFAYELFGESALYSTMPVVGLLCLLAVGLLARESLRHEAMAMQWFCAAGSVFIVATSYRQLESAAVPLADLPAQLFTLLTLLAAWKGVQRGFSLRYALAAGLCLGLAYAMRYTQVLLLVPVAVLAHAAQVRSRTRRSAAWRWLAVLGLAALFAAIPDLIYHWFAFGSPFVPGGAAELRRFQMSNVPTILATISRDFVRTNEFGFLVPFVLLGVVLAWQRNRAFTLFLGGSLAVVVGCQLPYRLLLLRDLLPLLPLAAVAAAYGMACLLQWSSRTRLGLLVAILAVTAVLGLRTRITLLLPLQGQISTFGYVSEDQRAAFDRLDQLLPSDAIVGTSLSSGAVELYSGRSTFRPGTWTSEQMDLFLASRLAAGIPVFLLQDGDEMVPIVGRVRSRYTVRPIAKLEIPVFYGGSAQGKPAELLQIW